MGAGLWFGDRSMVEEVGEDCSDCRQRKATGPDGLCTECRDISAQRTSSPPVFYDSTIVKAVAGAKE